MYALRPENYGDCFRRKKKNKIVFRSSPLPLKFAYSIKKIDANV